MAERRMFTKKIIDNDNFVSLSSSAQALYLHLCMAADDDGLCDQVSISMFKAHASAQDLGALEERGYLIPFPSGVVCIKHWRMHNQIKKDRYRPTPFHEEMAQLVEKPNKAYTLINRCLQNGSKVEPDWNQNGSNLEPQYRLGKVSIFSPVLSARARDDEEVVILEEE